MELLNCVEGINIKAISCVVPRNKVTIQEYAPQLLDEKMAKRMARGTGFSALRIADENTTTADLCAKAAECIFSDYDRNGIGALVLVTQTPDYMLPATSHILQHRLKLSNDILCIDINEGCSGYITGLYTSCLLALSLRKPVCLLAGETPSKSTSEKDRATRCIFGDAGTATIIEPGSKSLKFSFASYGDRANVIMMERNSFRKVESPKNDGCVYMDGIAIMNFALSEVSTHIDRALRNCGLQHEDIDLYACHQANKMILSSLAETLRISESKMPFVAGETGNESVASIPMVLTASQSQSLSRVCCCGFGVGLSIGLCIGDFSDITFYGVMEL